MAAGQAWTIPARLVLRPGLEQDQRRRVRAVVSVVPFAAVVKCSSLGTSARGKAADGGSSAFLLQALSQDTAAGSGPTREALATRIGRVLAEAGWNEEALSQLDVTFTSHLVNLVLKNVRSWSTASQFFQWLGKQEGFKHTVYTYAALIDCYGRTGTKVTGNTDGLDMEGVLEEMEMAGVKANVVVYTSLITAYGRKKRLDAAMAVFDRMLKEGCNPNVVTYTALMDMLVKAGRHEEARRIFEQMREAGCKLTSHTYTVLIHSLGEAGKAEEAEQLMTQMVKSGCKPTAITHSALISAYAKKGDGDRVLACFLNMKACGCRPGGSMYSKVISSLRKSGRVQEAEALEEEMEVEMVVKGVSSWGPAAVRVLEELKVREKTGGFILEVLKRLRDQEAAWSYFQWLKAGEDGYTHSEFAYNKMIEIVGRVPDLERMELLLDEMRAEGIDMSVVTFNTIISCYARANHLDGALQVFAQMKQAQCQPNHVTHTALISALGRAGEHERAMSMYQSMLDAGCKPNTHTFSAILSSLGRAGRLEEGCELLRKMPALGTVPNAFAYTTLISACRKANNLQLAIQVYEEMMCCNTKQTRISNSVIHQTLLDVGREEEARQFLAKQGSGAAAVGEDPLVEEIVLKHFSERQVAQDALLT